MLLHPPAGPPMWVEGAGAAQPRLPGKDSLAALALAGVGGDSLAALALAGVVGWLVRFANIAREWAKDVKSGGEGALPSAGSWLKGSAGNRRWKQCLDRYG